MASDAPGGKTVLIVEDNDDEREGLAAILLGEGFAVAAAADIPTALATLRTGPPTAVVLLDMLMPGQDGWDFLMLRRRDPVLAAVPVVITTALTVASPEWGAALSGGAACFRKPLPVGELLAEIRRLCGL
jgi:two-component system, chemotaxis family, sensor histidine kinase and response regulator PixL